MKSVLAVLALAGAAVAHNIVTHFHINGVPNQDCVRQARSADPLLDLASNDMACNAVLGNGNSKCNVKYGDEIAFEWRVDRYTAPADYPLKDGTIPVGVTDDSHKGPCAVYMKKVNDAKTAVGAGDGWFKVSDEGLTDGVFCTDRLRLANAPQPGTIPAGIAPGDYLMRAEFLTLNNAGAAGARQPQFYAGCVQVSVEGTDGSLVPDTVSIPGYVNINTPGLIWDIWNTPNGRYSNYPMVGPPPVGTAAGAPAPAPAPGIPPLPSAPVAGPSVPVVAVPSTPAVALPTAANTPSPPVYASVSAPPASKPSCNVKIVTETTFITLTSTTITYAKSTDTPDVDEDNSEPTEAEADEADESKPKYPHGHSGTHGSRRRRL